MTGLEKAIAKIRDDLENIDAINIRMVDTVVAGGGVSVKLAMDYERDGKVLGTEIAPNWMVEGDTLRLHLPPEVTLD